MSVGPLAAPPVMGPTKSRWPLRLVGIFATLLVIAAIARSYQPFPNDEERRYFGWWYGTEVIDESNQRAWIAEFASDGTLQIKFGRYQRVNADKDWQLFTNEEIGRWRVRDGVQQLVSDDPTRKVTWIERLDRWQRTGTFSRRHSYRTTLINERELHYQSLPEEHEYRSLHSARPVELPPRPLPPEQWPVAR